MQAQRSPSETSLMHYGYAKRTDIFALEVPEPHQSGIIADLVTFCLEVHIFLWVL